MQRLLKAFRELLPAFPINPVGLDDASDDWQANHIFWCKLHKMNAFYAF